MTFQRTLDRNEGELLSFYLLQAGPPNDVKTALQRLCGLLENGVFFPARATFRQPVIALLHNDDFLVRRWATKAIALLGLGTSTPPEFLSNVLNRETDFENKAWLIAAIGKITKETNVQKICNDAKIDYSKEYELAVRLFADTRFENLGTKFIDIEKDNSLALRWLALLQGYNKAPDYVAHDLHPNSEVVRQLNTHDDPIVSEYSVWALWQNPSGQFEDLLIPKDEFANKPAGVRRWIYRLFTKNPRVIPTELDIFQDFTNDKSTKAREGLALGISSVEIPELSNALFDWFQNEDDQNVKNLLYEHMAANSNENSHFKEIVVSEFKARALNDPFRTRMLASAASTALLSDLRKVKLGEEYKQLREDNEEQSNFFQNGGPKLTININNSGSIGNLALGKQDINAENFTQSFSHAGIDHENLKALLSHVQEQLGDDEGAKLVDEINQVSKNKDPKTAKSLKDRLTKLAGTVTAGTKAASAIEKLNGVLEGWIV